MDFANFACQQNGSLAGAIPVCTLLFYLATFWSKFAMMLAPGHG